MLAKLFNDISVASLIRSIGLVVLVFVILFFSLGKDMLEFRVFSHGWQLPNYLLLLIGLPAVVFASLLFNTAVNNVELHKQDYQEAVITGILLAPVITTQSSLNLVLSLPLVVLLILKLFSLADKPDISYTLFDIGGIIAVLVYLEPASMVLILLVWLALINYGRLGLKEMLMPVTGVLAVWFLTASILFALGGWELIEVEAAFISGLSLGTMSLSINKVWRVTPLVLLLIPAFFSLISIFAKAKVLRRQTYGFLMLFGVVVLVAGSVFYQPAGLWLWLAFPVSAMLVTLIQGVAKNWMRDLVYLLVLFYVALFFFGR